MLKEKSTPEEFEEALNKLKENLYLNQKANRKLVSMKSNHKSSDREDDTPPHSKEILNGNLTFERKDSKNSAK